MSPSVLLEIVATLLSGGISPGPPLKGGMLDASLGAVAAFFGLVALLFALPLVVFLGAPFLAVLTLSLVVAGCAALSILAARRAPRVTNRNLALAKAGYVGSVVALTGCAVALVVAGGRALV